MRWRRNSCAGIGWEPGSPPRWSSRSVQASGWSHGRRTRRRKQARRAEAAKAFLVDIFSASDPRIASDTPRGEITARALLDLGATRIEREFADDPRTQIDLLGTVADIYRELGVTDRATALNARKVELAKKTYGELSEPVLNDAVQQASYACAEQSDRCADLLREADALLNRAGRNDGTLRADWWVAEGQRLRPEQGKDAERRAALEKGVAIYRDVAPRNTGYVTAIEELASDHQMRGDFDGSIALHKEALGVAGGLPARNDAELQTIYGNLAIVYQQTGDLLNAGATFAKAADIAERTSGRDFVTYWGVGAEAARTLHLAGERQTRRHAIRGADDAFAAAVAACGRRQRGARILRRSPRGGGSSCTWRATPRNRRARP